jgi:hypothetical protein
MGATSSSTSSLVRSSSGARSSTSTSSQKKLLRSKSTVNTYKKAIAKYGDDIFDKTFNELTIEYGEDSFPIEFAALILSADHEQAGSLDEIKISDMQDLITFDTIIPNSQAFREEIEGSECFDTDLFDDERWEDLYQLWTMVGQRLTFEVDTYSDEYNEEQDIDKEVVIETKDNAPINTNPPVQVVDYKITRNDGRPITVHVIRDDLLIGGTKQRAMCELMANSADNEFIYASPLNGYAMVAISYCASLFRKKAVIFVSGSNHSNSTKKAENLNINILLQNNR